MFRGSYIFCMVLISVMVLGLLFGSRGSDENDRVREALFPELKSNQASVSRIEIHGARTGPQVTLILEGGQWRLQEQTDRPVDLLKINRFVEALVEADKLERKTFKQEHFHHLGVDDSAIGVSLVGQNTMQKTIWVGDMAKNRTGRYIRMLEGDGQAVWLISSGLTELSTNPADWLASSQDIP
jgi:hypothetical protein